MTRVWSEKTLGDVCAFENGDRGENYPSRSVQTSSGVPFINAGHLSETGIDFSGMNYIPRERFNLLGNGKIRASDILFCLRGSLGKFACVGELSEGAIASSLVILRPSEAVVSRFIEYYLASDLCANELARYRNGAAQPNLSAANLKRFRIPVPPAAEQRRIVRILDEAFDGVATAKANAGKSLKSARAVFEGHLQSLIVGGDWAERTLEDCCEQIFAGGDVPKGRLAPERTSIYNVPIFANGENNDGLYGFTDAPRVLKPSVTVSARGTIGFAAIRSEPFFPIVRLIVLVPDETQVALSFLYYAVRGMEFGNTGTSIPQLTVPNIKASKLKLPPLQEQVRVVGRLSSLATEVERLEDVYQRKLSELDALKQSFLREAFSGRL